MHLAGQRERTADGDWASLRCVLCEQVLPERSRGISQDTWVLISHSRSAGRPIFQMELRDDMEHPLVLDLGPMGYWRCDAPPTVLIENVPV